MSIERWQEYDLQKKKKCPECAGTGKDNATLDWKCWRCEGSGEIDIEEREIYKNI